MSKLMLLVNMWTSEAIKFGGPPKGDISDATIYIYLRIYILSTIFWRI